MRKRKVALIFGYNGKNFYGSQRQTQAGARAVENDLERGLFQARLITEANYGDLKKIKWSRSSRTDKGVHARSTVVGLKMEMDSRNIEEILQDLNSALPDDLQAFGNIHSAIKSVANSFNAKGCASYREYEYLFPIRCLYTDGEFTTERLTQLNSLCAKFQGTKSYHNFTKKLEKAKAQSKRYIIKFEVSDTLVTLKDLAFIRFSITGQSFLYHQIRCMIGSVIATVLGKIPEGSIERAFQEEVNLAPLAPAEGLLLYTVHYLHYNRKHVQKSIELTTEEEKRCTEFYYEHILPTIYEAENESRV